MTLADFVILRNKLNRRLETLNFNPCEAPRAGIECVRLYKCTIIIIIIIIIIVIITVIRVLPNLFPRFSHLPVEKLSL